MFEIFSEALPEGSYVIKPEVFLSDIKDSMKDTNFSQAVISSIVRSPHLMGIGKAIVETVKELEELRNKSCPDERKPCVLPRFDSRERQSISSLDVFESLKVPESSRSTRFMVSKKLDGTMHEVAAYKIEAASEDLQIIAEVNLPKSPTLCLERLAAR